MITNEAPQLKGLRIPSFYGTPTYAHMVSQPNFARGPLNKVRGNLLQGSSWSRP